MATISIDFEEAVYSQIRDLAECHGMTVSRAVDGTVRAITND